MTNDNEREPVEAITETTTTLVYAYDKNGEKQTIEVLTPGRTEVLGAWIR
jgi:hypothetical protein